MFLICDTICSFVISFILVGLISLINLSPRQEEHFQKPLSNFKSLSSKSCCLKFSCTFGVAIIIIFFCIPMLFMKSRSSSAIPIAEHVFPVPSP